MEGSTHLHLVPPVLVRSLSVHCDRERQPGTQAESSCFLNKLGWDTKGSVKKPGGWSGSQECLQDAGAGVRPLSLHRDLGSRAVGL